MLAASRMDDSLRLQARAARIEIGRRTLRGAALLDRLLSVPFVDRDVRTDELLGIDNLPADVSDLPRGSVPYFPSGVDDIIATVTEVPVLPDDEIVDLGSGLGRVVILAHLLTGARASRSKSNSFAARGVGAQRWACRRSRSLLFVTARGPLGERHVPETHGAADRVAGSENDRGSVGRDFDGRADQRPRPSQGPRCLLGRAAQPRTFDARSHAVACCAHGVRNARSEPSARKRSPRCKGRPPNIPSTPARRLPRPPR